MKLTAQERQVLIGIAEGKKLTEIAGIVGRSDKTVSHYKQSLCRKVGLFDNASLARYAVGNGFVEPIRPKREERADWWQQFYNSWILRLLTRPTQPT